MTKKTQTVDIEEEVLEQEVDPVETVDPAELLPFNYPSIGNGVTIMARNQAEADEKAKRHPLNV